MGGMLRDACSQGIVRQSAGLLGQVVGGGELKGVALGLH